jgi:hypothetical protein
MEVACLHRASGTLLVTDALVAIGADPPALFDSDPTPLLFHARDRGDQPLEDTPERRRRGWRRLVLFASYLRPAPLSVAGWGEVLRHAFAPGLRSPRSHFGLYPFRWHDNWEEAFQQLVPEEGPRLQVAPVLERLVFPRCRDALVTWVRALAKLNEVRWLVPAHYEAPVACSPERLRQFADELQSRPWAPDEDSWSTLARIDRSLLRLGLVPSEPAP